jgi:putative endonuclease
MTRRLGFSDDRRVFFAQANVQASQTPSSEFIHPLREEFPAMRQQKTYFVYIMSNRSKTLYTGMTNNLGRRVREHKLGIGSGFAARYKLDRLVYFERFEDVHNAIEREKEIKGWLRVKKIALIVSVNPAWRDLSLEWLERHAFRPDAGVALPTKTPR